MLQSILVNVVVSLSVGFLTFVCGVLVAKPLKSKIAEWKRRRAIRGRDLKRVSLFFIQCSSCTEDLKKLLLSQTRRQNLFEFSICDHSHWKVARDKSERLSEFRTNSRLAFVEAFQEIMVGCGERGGVSASDQINVAVTDLEFPKNFYTWNTKDRRGIVIGISSLNLLFRKQPDLVNKIVLRVMQRMLLYSLGIEGLVAHRDTRGCLFDLTERLTDLQFSVDKTFLCTECEKRIVNAEGLDLLDEARSWIEASRPAA